MAPLASAYVRLRPILSESEVRSSAARAGATGGAIMGREFNTALRRTARIVAGLGIGTFAAEAGRFALHMADQFELSRSRLETVTKNIGGNFSNLSGAVQSADDRMAKFGFTNAQTEGSIASLETATKSTTKAIADQALAANIARGRNISLESATQILMRVETGHVAMLSRLGIATKDANGHLLTQAAALKQLAALYGGAAARYAGTFAGKQEALRAALQNSASQIGVALLPAFVDLANVLQHDVLPPIEHAAEFFDRNRKTIEPLVGDLIKLAAAYKLIRLAQRGIGAFQLAGRAGAAGGAISAVEGARGLSPAEPMYVFVVNNGLPGGGVPPVASTTAREGAAAEESIGTKISKAFNSDTAKALILPVVGYTVYKLTLDSLKKYGFGIPGVFQVGGQHTTPSVQFGAGFQKKVDQLGGPDAALAYYKALNAQTKAAIAATHTFHGLADAMAKVQGRQVALSQGTDDLRNAIHNMATTAGQSGRALAGNSDAALANRDAIRGAVTQAESYISTLRAQHVGHLKVQAAALAAATAIETNASKVYGNKNAVDALLKSLRFLPTQIRAALSGVGSVGEQIGALLDYSIADGIGAYASVATDQAGVIAAQMGKAARFGLDGSVGGNTVTPGSPSTPAKINAKNYGKALGKSLSDGFSPVVDKGVANATKAAFDHAKSQMTSDVSSIKSYLAQQKQTIFSAFSSISATGTDSLGATGAANIEAQLNANVRLADQFTRLYFRLDNAGASSRVLDMFEQLGPAAIPTMRLWLAHPSKLRRATRDLRRIGADAASISQRATEDKYGPLIHRDLEKLPRKLAHEFAQELRNLNITTDTNKQAKKRGAMVRAS
ncbi:MAG: hypothetical protein JO222_09275 [Frankiales bacterium]|nr:hypothetical protein [Frankiales bacterium]